jgi:hypothetical protein
MIRKFRGQPIKRLFVAEPRAGTLYMSCDVTPEQWPAGGNTIIIPFFNPSIATVGSANITCPRTDNSADLCDSSLNGEKAHSKQRFVNSLKPNGKYTHHLL